MYTFKTKPDGFRQIRRTVIFRDYPLLLLALSSGMLLAATGKPERTIDWYFIGTMLLIAAVIFAFLLPQIITERRHIYEEFLLIIDEDGITREQYNANTLTVSKDEVSEIYKTSNGKLVINGIPGSDPIIIPAQMEESGKLEHLLSEIKPFSKVPFFEKNKWLIILTVFGLFAAFNFATSKPLVWISGSMLLGLYSYLLYKIHRHKNIHDIPKAHIFFALYLVFITIRKMY